jgi:DNA repair exonuclease SbcCD ATPase subunit
VKKESNTKNTDRWKVKVVDNSSMLVFEYMLVENAFTFFGANYVPLENTGLVLLRGCNMDTRVPSNNAVGKSRLWFSLIRLLFGRKGMEGESPTLALNVIKKNFRLETGFRINGHHYVVRETKNHSEFGSGLKVLRDGKPWGLKNDPEGLRKQVQEVIGRTYEEFIGTVIWKQNQTHMLLDGTPAQRVKWISDLFGLSSYDEMFDEFSKRLRVVQESLVDMVDVKEEAKLLEREIANTGDVADLHRRCRKIKSKITQLIEESDTAQTDLEKLGEREQDLKLAARLESKHTGKKKNKTSPDEIKASIKKMEAELAMHEKAEQNASKITKQRKRYKTAKKNLIRLYQEVFNGGAGVPKLSDIKPLLREADVKIGDLSGQLERAKKHVIANASCIRAQRELDELGYEDCTLEYLRDMLKAHEETVVDVEKQIAVLERVTKRNELLKKHVVECPTCGSTVKRKKLKAVIADAQSKLDELNKALKGHNREVAEFQRAVDLRIQADRKGAGDELDPEKIEKKIAKIRFRKAALEKMLDFALAMKEAKDILDNIDTPDLLKGNADDYAKRIAWLKAEIETLYKVYDDAVSYHADQQQLDGIRSDYSIKGSMVDAYDKTKIRRVRLQSEQKERDARIGDLRVRYDRLRTRRDDNEDKLKRLEKLKPRLQKISELTRKERIYKALKKAYDKNGLKVVRLRELLKEIRNSLPVWTRIMFTEPNVRIDVTGNEKKIGFDITQTTVVETKDSKGRIKTRTEKKTYDARGASGSERTRISMCLMLTLADVAFANKRCNLMVWDEFEGGLDKVSRDILADEVIPILSKKFPSIYVTTHRLGIGRENINAELTITRKDNKSSVAYASINPVASTNTANNKPAKKQKKNRSK